MRQQLKQLLGLKEKIADPQVKPNDQEMLDNITELLRKLVVETFVVEKQPPQVKGTSFFCLKIKVSIGIGKNTADFYIFGHRLLTLLKILYDGFISN